MRLPLRPFEVSVKGLYMLSLRYISDSEWSITTSPDNQHSGVYRPYKQNSVYFILKMRHRRSVCYYFEA